MKNNSVIKMKHYDDYISMQKNEYRNLANKSNYNSIEKIDFVVGSYELHNAWSDYDDFLMKYVYDNFKEKYALDFGCGPCRNIIKFSDKFKRIMLELIFRKKV